MADSHDKPPGKQALERAVHDAQAGARDGVDLGRVRRVVIADNAIHLAGEEAGWRDRE